MNCYLLYTLRDKSRRSKSSTESRRLKLIENGWVELTEEDIAKEAAQTKAIDSKKVKAEGLEKTKLNKPIEKDELL